MANKDLNAMIQEDLDDKQAELIGLESELDSDPQQIQALREEIENLQSMLIGNANEHEDNDYSASDHDQTHLLPSLQQASSDPATSSTFALPLHGQENSAGRPLPTMIQSPSNHDGSNDSTYDNTWGFGKMSNIPRPSPMFNFGSIPAKTGTDSMPGSWVTEHTHTHQPQGLFNTRSPLVPEPGFMANNTFKRRLHTADTTAGQDLPNKSQRTTPSPYSTYDTTPTSIDSLESEVETTLPLGREQGNTLPEHRSVISLSSDPVSSEQRGGPPDHQSVTSLSSDPTPPNYSTYGTMSDEDFARIFHGGLTSGNQALDAALPPLSYLQNPQSMSYANTNMNGFANSSNTQGTPSAGRDHSYMRPSISGGSGSNAQNGRGLGSLNTFTGPEVIDLDSDSEDVSATSNLNLPREIIDLEAPEWQDDLSASAMQYGPPSHLFHGQAGSSYNDAMSGLNYGWNTNFYGTNDFNATVYANNMFNNAGLDPNADLTTYNKYVDRINHVAKDPTRTKGEITSLLENIRPDEELPLENREGTPEAMVYPLMEHQKLGLAWLKKMEASEQSGGILADDMGLGKTIQALALMVSRKSDDPGCKTNLIVAPVALMKQWEREVKVKLKSAPHNLTTLVLHGHNRHASWEKIKRHDVVLTTFGVLSSELKRYEKIQLKKRVDPNWRPTSKTDELSLLGDNCNFYRIIIDEAQCIKNRLAKVSIGASLLKAKSRFCMTGTPMMNRVDELYPLLRFLRIVPWSDSKYFNTHFTKPLKSQSPAARSQAMKKLQVLLKAVLLRRTKKSLIDGKPILNLPAKSIEHQTAEFSQDEVSLYRALETKSQLQFNKYLKAGLVGKNYSNVLILLLRLRQACCHPYLLRDFAKNKDDDGGLSEDDFRKLASQLHPDAVTRLKAQVENAEDNALDCPICMDAATDTIFFVPCGHGTCSECFSRLTDPSQAIAIGDADGDGGFKPGEGKCPNCRAKISPSKVIDIVMFRKIFLPQTIKPDPDATANSDSEDDDSDDSDDEESDEEGDDVNENGDLKDFVVKDDDSVGFEEETGSNSDNKSEDTLVDSIANSIANTPKRPKKASKKSKGKEKAVKIRKTMGQLRKEAATSQKARRRYLNRIAKDYIPSAKIEKTMEILDELKQQADQERRPMEKVIIFSQFTSLLDLLELPVNRAGYGYQRYDGSMSSSARQTAIESFTDKHNVTILLTSLKAGNAGLNLTAASQVIMFDPFWNPYIEDQAVDRAHRIGQTRPVQVHRLFVSNTIEDRILTLQEQKRDLIESALDEGESRRIGRLGVKDMAFLFDVPLAT